MAKKISRKQLLKEPDEFISFTGKLIQTVIRCQKQIMIAAGVFITVLLIFTLTRIYTNRMDMKAFSLLDQANTQYHSMVNTMGSALALKEVENNFDHILNRYSRYQASKIAGIYYGNYCYDAGNYEKAAELFTKALDHFNKKPAYLNLILSGLAYSHKANKNHEASAKYFEMIAFSSLPLLKDEALFNLGKSYDELGNETKRDEAYKMLVSDHPDSIYTQLIKDRFSITG